jgi:dihydrofolate synthase/folylpolyglutamate synthase
VAPDESGPFVPPSDRFDASIGDALAWLDRHVNLDSLPERSRLEASAGAAGRVAALAAAMGDPQTLFPIIHVTGGVGSGKSSIAAMAASLLLAEGISPGLLVSPHVESLNDRLRVAGEAIGDAELAQQLAALAELELFVGVKGTWLDLVTAAALRWFADEAIEAAVIENSGGGGDDATSVAEAAVVVSGGAVPSALGGLIGAGTWLVADHGEGAQYDAAGLWLRGDDFGAENHRLALGGRVADLYTPAGRYEDVFVPFFGAHQVENAAVAVAAVQAFLGSTLDQAVVEEGLAAARLPGRLEVAGRSPLVVLDCASTASSAAAVGQALREDFPPNGSAADGSRRITVVMGCTGETTPGAMLQALDPAHVVACEPSAPLPVSGSAVVGAAEGLGFTAEDAGSVGAALESARERAEDGDVILVTGSMAVVGEARRLLRPA